MPRGLIIFFIVLLLSMPIRAETAADLMAIYDSAASNQSGEIPLNQPHRNTAQMGAWVETQVTNAMTFNPETWFAKNNAPSNDSKRLLAINFDPYAMTEYATYLDTSGLVKMLADNRLKMNAILAGNPALVSEGVLNGTYRWLYDVPVLLSFYPASMSTLKGDAKPQNLPPNQKVTVRVQVGRKPLPKNADDPNQDGLKVELWSVLP